MNLKSRWIAVVAMISTIVPAFSQIKTGQAIASDGQEIDQQVVHIGGHVKRTGQVKFTQGLTLYQAIQAAGGVTEFASMRRVTVYRDGRCHQYDLTKAGNIQVKLNQGDTIVVPQKNWFSH
jgi:NADH:ubiquinone oxidoreductase subunit F (NADH-binding)